MLLPQGFEFISDEEIVARLSHSGSSATAHEARHHFYKATLNSMRRIKSVSGHVVDNAGLYHLLLQHFPEEFAPKGHVGVDVSGSAGEPIEVFVNPVLRAVMARYGRVDPAPSLKEATVKRREDYLEMMKLKTMCKIARSEVYSLEANAQYQDVAFDKKHVPGAAWIGTKVLSLAVDAARHLPKMDVLAGVDAYCVAFLEDAPGLHQTEVCRGAADEADWTQTPFEWSLPDDPRVLRHDRRLVIMVYDKDQITNDDLIGCVTIGMGEIVKGPIDGWREIKRHGQPTFEWIKGMIYTSKHDPPQLKVRVALHTETADASDSLVIPVAEKLDGHPSTQTQSKPHDWHIGASGEVSRNENPLLPLSKMRGRSVYGVEPLGEAVLGDVAVGYPDHGFDFQSLPVNGPRASGVDMERGLRALSPARGGSAPLVREQAASPMGQPGSSPDATPWSQVGSHAGVYSSALPLPVNRGLHLSETASAAAKVDCHIVFA